MSFFLAHPVCKDYEQVYFYHFITRINVKHLGNYFDT